MNFNCGLTNEAWEEKYRQWHSFFPLWPRTVKVVEGVKVCAWMELIERRATHVWFQGAEKLVVWEYRTLDMNSRSTS